ncbi:alanyl-tRNA editing protein AlaX-M-like protein [Chytriomyces cf. hyalinus JEL632]|nr:alanyl-tRNA editing protein AlaX-M-like protein [Chytriomyces cf. hyalinus JEL632]KAI8845333.1 alanyl-tRNA editing protein AlaX-M-like protein [Chytriomyces cf. hyalinus JEL632]
MTNSEGASLPATTRVYFSDSYLFSLSGAVVLAAETDAADPDRRRIVLDRTIFHPQGGGQPSDKGTIEFNGIVFNVDSMHSDRETGVIEHIGSYASTTVDSSHHDAKRFEVGNVVNLSIDEPLRRMHCRLHSAGHFLDSMMKLVRPDLVAASGNHAPGMSWVNYTGDLDAGERSAVREALQGVVDERLRGENVGVTVELDEGTMRRSVRFGTYDGCECGGTHVGSLGEIGRVFVTKVSKNGKNGVRVSYSVK